MFATSGLNIRPPGGNLFGPYLGSGVCPIGGQFDVKPIAERRQPAFVHDPFDFLTGSGIGGYDVSREVAAGIEQFFRAYDPVDQPPVGSGLSVEVIAG